MANKVINVVGRSVGRSVKVGRSVGPGLPIGPLIMYRLPASEFNGTHLTDWRQLRESSLWLLTVALNFSPSDRKRSVTIRKEKV